MNVNKNHDFESKFKAKAISPKQLCHQETDQDLIPRFNLSNLRHELRTPLNAIIGYSEMLLEDAQAYGKKSLASDLQKIQTAGHVLNEHLNDFFETSIPSGKLKNFNDEKMINKLQYDLRIPLNTVIGYCEMLQEEYDSNIITNFGRDLKKILTAAENFLTHIKAILANASIETSNTDTISEKSDYFSSIEEDENAIHPIPDDRSFKITDPQRFVLVVDDNGMNRDLLCRYLKRQGLGVITAENGIQALEMVNSRPVDLILLDVLMPDLNGYQVLKRLKSEKAWYDIPVVMISALEDIEGVVKCIEIGADDYLPKPFNPVLLKARINNCLEKKRLSDIEKEHKKMIKETFGKYVSHEVRDEVLSGRIPLDGERKDVTVLFADLRDFTPLTESIPPKEMVRILNGYFTEMAPAIRSRNGSILQYLGDEIYAVFGAPIPLRDHPRQAVAAALDMRQRLVDVNNLLEMQGHVPLRHGIGIHSGPAIAANLGSSERLTYGLVGDTVNLASRIQGLTKQFNTDIIISAQSRARLGDEFAVEELPSTFVKGKKSVAEIYKVV